MSFCILQHKGSQALELCSASDTPQKSAYYMFMSDVKRNTDRYHRVEDIVAEGVAFRDSLEKSHSSVLEGRNSLGTSFLYYVQTPEGKVMPGTCTRSQKLSMNIALNMPAYDDFCHQWEKKKAEGYSLKKVILKKELDVSVEDQDV